MTRAHAVRLLAVVLAVAVVGCGKSDVEKFADRLRPLDAQLTQQKARFATTLRTVRLGSRADARALRQQVQGVAGIVETMDGLDAPSGVETRFDRYLRASEAQVKALSKVASALESGDRARLRAAGEKARLSEGAVRRAGDALRTRLNEG